MVRGGVTRGTLKNNVIMSGVLFFLAAFPFTGYCADKWEQNPPSAVVCVPGVRCVRSLQISRSSVRPGPTASADFFYLLTFFTIDHDTTSLPPKLLLLLSVHAGVVPSFDELNTKHLGPLDPGATTFVPGSHPRLGDYMSTSRETHSIKQDGHRG